ncbi:MAG: amino acid adenylation domain-containing protein [Alphaproteobacteria bacterium]
MTSLWQYLKPSNAVAIRDNGRDVTYAQLLGRAAALGEKLKAQGVTPETTVGLQIDKSAEYVIAMLAVWYAGGAFVPLPPSLPLERAKFIISDANIRHFVQREDVTAETTMPAPFTPAQETLAYIIYTSGSTGKPKGVMVEHRGLMNLFSAQAEAFAMKNDSRSLFMLSVNFDASVSDIGVALYAGATLVIDGSDKPLPQVLRDNVITHVDMPPSLLKSMLPEEMPGSLQTIVIGGEACPPETVRAFAKKFRVVNVYGPTEATVCTSLNICNERWEKPLIGEPLPEVEYTVINGELQIGGNMLARGYVNLPALTADKFITRGGKRFYRTGDSVRETPQGLEFLGRIDRQFKLRGQLVEPDEVEAQLRSHPQVMKAAVIKRDEQLVAFVALSDKAALAGLDTWLKTRLPVYMVPQHFEVISRLPLTVTGKTDYAALATLTLTNARARMAPRSKTEHKLFSIWRAVLKHDDFGVTDAFYAAGGDSLGIIRMVLESERQGLPLAPAFVAQHMTIEAQAAHIGQDSTALTAAWLKADVAFSPDDKKLLDAAAKRPRGDGEIENILLTGATGFLGSRVLHELITQTRARIYCLVRAPDAAGALHRMKEAAAKFSVPAVDWSRIVPVTGDLSQPQAGLTAAEWSALAGNIDSIYHCAACVNMVLPYTDMRGANTAAALELLRLAATGKRKTLHYASTLSVFVATDKNSGTLLESDRLENVTTVYGGYAQTKFAAEWMVLQTPAEAVPVTHYRLGLITGDTVTGASSVTDFLALFFKGAKALGALPDSAGNKLFVDITPVDYAAKALVYLSLHGKGEVYHIANKKSLSLDELAAPLGLRMLPEARWLDLIRNKPLGMDETAAALSLCRIFGTEEFARHRTMDLFQATDVSFDTREADKILLPAGIVCPVADEKLVRLYIDHALKNTKPAVKICLFGPESTGKSTLAEKLAQHYNAPFVPEYAKEHIAANDGAVAYEDIPKIAAGQAKAEAEIKGAPLLFCDTDLITTTIWSDWLFKNCPGWVRDAAESARYDLYFLMDIDTEWVADIHRYLPEDRANFLKRCEDELRARGLRYIKLSGSWDDKFKNACAAVDQLRGLKHA